MEVWKEIEGFNGFYEVSNKGGIRSKGNKSGRVDGKWHERSLSANKDGYLKVRLVCQGKDITQRVHTLVAKAFIPNPNNYDTVNHIDGNKENNCAENLEWMNRKDQLLHAYKLGLKAPMQGKNNANSKLSDDDVKYIREHYVRNSKEYGTVALSKKFGVSNRVIGLVTRGLSYKNVK